LTTSTSQVSGALARVSVGKQMVFTGGKVMRQGYNKKADPMRDRLLKG
jgi:hypothetical protein